MKQKRLLTCQALALLLPVIGSMSFAADTFTFAGYTFNQTNTPNEALLLGNGAVLGGAVFSPGLPTTVTTRISQFPGGTGFDTNLTLGYLTGLGSGGSAVNLPNGDSGVFTRHGIQVGWSGHRGLPNRPGPDFVVYESASTSNTVEGIMARVHRDPQNTWSDWYYFAPDDFQGTTGAQGLMSYGFDLSDMGVPADALIDKIQVANLMQADRISGMGTNIGGTLVGEGQVLFDGSNNVVPDAGPFDSNRIFDNTTYDPDPLFIGALHDVAALPPRFRAVRLRPNQVDLNVATASGLWIMESTETPWLPASWRYMDIFANIPGGAMTVSDTGQNGRLPPQSVPLRVYRITNSIPPKAGFKL
jgi:hypothetical protein